MNTFLLGLSCFFPPFLSLFLKMMFWFKLNTAALRINTKHSIIRKVVLCQSSPMMRGTNNRRGSSLKRLVNAAWSVSMITNGAVRHTHRSAPWSMKQRTGHSGSQRTTVADVDMPPSTSPQPEKTEEWKPLPMSPCVQVPFP